MFPYQILLSQTSTRLLRLLFNTVKIVAWLAILGVSVLLLCTVLCCPDYTLLPLGLGLVWVVLWGAGKIMMIACRKQHNESKKA